ncbi:MAG TPA: hypothetical protein VGQ41_18640 [Pyrinomonadaceae bacterium]|nr:hypothetical protein [Pyrinomonadaceae bacterium]
MTDQTRHFKEEIQELADDRLSAAGRIELEKHLELCDECRREFEALRWTKQITREKYVAELLPAKLNENILAALELEDRKSRDNVLLTPNWWPRQRASLAYVILLLVAIALVLSYFLLRGRLGTSPELLSKPEQPIKQESPSKSNEAKKSEPPTKPELSPEPELSKQVTPPKRKLQTRPTSFSRPDLPSEVARDYREYRTEKIRLTLTTADVKEMEKFFSDEHIPFETRVFDLGMMNYRLLGGRVNRLDTRKSAFFVYRGEGNAILVCQMYLGAVRELPAGAVLRENKGIHFYIYRKKGLTVAFWQEGAVICVLTSEIDSEQLIQLAFAKAIKV